MSVIEVASPESAFRHCETVTRQRARNFYYGLKLLPEPRRSAMYAVYAWMRRADDIADGDCEAGSEGGTDRLTSLDEFRRLTDEALAGSPAEDDPLWTALALTAKRFPMREEHFHVMLEGQIDDLRQRRYDTFDQLRDYCYRVASSVGLLCIEVWGYEDPRSPSLAIDRGIAFQLTNIIRDFSEDLRGGRVYLPREDFERHRLEPNELLLWSNPKACREFMDQQIDRALSYYERSAPLDQLIDVDCRPTLWAMTSIYRGLLEKAREDPARIISNRRIRLSSLAKATIAIRAKWMLHTT